MRKISMSSLKKAIEEYSKPKKVQQNTFYPYWDIPFDSQMIIKFLPDKNEDNAFFWVKTYSIVVTFNSSTRNPGLKETVIIPTLKNRNPDAFCPLTVKFWNARKEFADREDLDIFPLALREHYIFQGLVVDSPLDDPNPEQQIKFFRFTRGIGELIIDELKSMDDDEPTPCDIEDGSAFILVKRRRRGGFADYSRSRFGEPYALSAEEIEAYEEQAVDLSTLVPEPPTDTSVYEELIEAAIKFEQFDNDRWGHLVRSFTSGASDPGISSRPERKIAGTVETDDDFDEEEETSKVSPLEKLRELKRSKVKSVEEDSLDEEDEDEPTPVVKRDPSEILASLKARAKKSAR